MMNLTDKEYKALLQNIPQLENVVKKFQPSINGSSRILLMEFLLFGLSEYSLLSRSKIEDGIQFRDMLSSMFTMPESDEDFEDEDDSSEYKFKFYECHTELRRSVDSIISIYTLTLLRSSEMKLRLT